MSDRKFKKYTRTVPKVFRPATNPVIRALLKAWAGQDESVLEQLDNTKAQLFVKTAEGSYLDKLAASVGVRRPIELGLLDDQFRELIPNLSLKAKQIRKSFYDTSDVFWGPTFSRANITSLNSELFNLSDGDIISVIVDGGEQQNIRILPEDIQTNGAATAEEVVAILNRIKGATAEESRDALTGQTYVNLRTDAPGFRGSLEIVASSGIGSTKLDLPVAKHQLSDLDQRVSIYEINPSEVIIEIPAVVPALRRTLKGSHHFHEDATLESPIAPADTPWQGSFLYDTNGETPFTVTSITTEIQEDLLASDIYTKVTVADASDFPNEEGFLIFNWGKENQEQPVKYRGVPNSNTIFLDPSHVFNKTHVSGSSVNFLSIDKSFIPNVDGTDLAIYLTSPAEARRVVQDILRSLAAAGVMVTFIILAPDYKYIIDNPYLFED